VPKNKGWFRVYDRMIDSADILELSDNEFRVLLSLWALASSGGDENGLVKYRNGSLRKRICPTTSQVKFDKTMAKLIESALIIQNDEGIYPKDWTRHQYIFDSRKPSNKRKVQDCGEEMGKSSGSDGEVLGKTDTDSDTEPEPETETDSDADTDIEKKQSKTKHADFVTFTAEEYEKLKSQFGEAGAKEWTETLNLWKGSKGKKCASDYLTILSWARKDVQHGRTGANTKPGARRSTRADASQDEWNSELSRGNQL